jgi:hypothetical protein
VDMLHDADHALDRGPAVRELPCRTGNQMEDSLRRGRRNSFAVGVKAPWL